MTVREFTILSETVNVLAAAREAGAEAVVFAGEPLPGTDAQLTGNAALKLGLPTMFAQVDPVYEGGLAAYAPDEDEMWRRTVALVDRILRGARPADLPVEGPTKFNFVVNLGTARALGLTIPQSVLAAATEVIS